MQLCCYILLVAILCHLLYIHFKNFECNAIAVAYYTVMSKVALPGLTSSSRDTNNVMSEKTGAKGKNPFHSIGDWNLSNIKDIEVVIGEVNETTSKFTREKNANNRYWKAPVSFRTTDGKYESKIIKMFNCDVPYMSSTNYGKDYIVARLNKIVGEKIAAAALEKNIIVDTSDKRAVSDENSWWLTVNNADGRMGLVDSHGEFDPKDLVKVFTNTEKGMKVNFDLVFNIKLAKTDKKDRSSKDAFNLVSDCSRGAVKALNQDIEAPPTEGAIPQQAASKQDVASQELIDMFNEFAV